MKLLDKIREATLIGIKRRHRKIKFEIRDGIVMEIKEKVCVWRKNKRENAHETKYLIKTMGVLSFIKIDLRYLRQV